MKILLFIMNALVNKAIEIVGLQLGTEGRKCSLHPVNCGSAVVVGTLLKIRNAQIEVEEKIQVLIVEELDNVTTSKSRGRPKKVIPQYSLRSVLTLVDTLKVFILYNGIESCCVGFVAVAFQRLHQGQLDGRILKVQKLSIQADNISELRRNKEFNGVGLSIIIA